MLCLISAAEHGEIVMTARIAMLRALSHGKPAPPRRSGAHAFAGRAVTPLMRLAETSAIVVLTLTRTCCLPMLSALPSLQARGCSGRFQHSCSYAEQ
jgi:hypothetical protein